MESLIAGVIVFVLIMAAVLFVGEPSLRALHNILDNDKEGYNE